MMNRVFGSNLALAMSLFASACGSSPTIDSNKLATAEQEVIGGFGSGGKAFEAVGTLGIEWDGEYYMMCTATLIGPKTVLTAKHCTVFLDDGWTPAELVGQPLMLEYKLSFAVGNGNRPDRKYEVVWTSASQINEGGVLGLGNDVAVAHLKEAVTDLAPLEYTTSPLSNDLLNTKGIVAGYGVQNNEQSSSGVLDGTRKVGYTTMTAYEGRFYELALGSYEAFIQDLVNSYGQGQVDECLADSECKTMIEGWYNDTVLLPDYEFWTSKQAGDAVTCQGDSGGPLLKKILTADGSERRQILGVVSGGMGSAELACDYGTIYAGFGLDTQSFLAKSLNWEDACAGESLQGECTGDVARLCKIVDGERFFSETNCADFGQMCDRGQDGFVGCFERQIPSPVERVSKNASWLQGPRTLRIVQQAAAAGLLNPARRAVIERLSK